MGDVVMVKRHASPQALLNVPLTCTPKELRRAYLQAVKQHHPDHGGCSRKLQEVNQAYAQLKVLSRSVLSDEHLRRARSQQPSYAAQPRYEPPPSFLTLTPKRKESLRKIKYTVFLGTLLSLFV